MHQSSLPDQRSKADWRATIETAKSVREVLDASTSFLAKWTPHRLGALPPQCKPPAMFVEPEDIAAYAYILAAARCREDHVTAELEAMHSFFSAAAIRLSQLLTAPPPENLARLFIHRGEKTG